MRNNPEDVMQPRRSRLRDVPPDMSDGINNALNNRQTRTPDRIREDLDDTLHDIGSDLVDEAIDNLTGNTILGRNRNAEARAQQMRQQTTRRSVETESINDEDAAVEDSTDTGEDETGNTENESSHSNKHSRGESKSLDQVGFFGRLILIGAVALVIFTVGKYAFDSLLRFDRTKTVQDFDENFQMMIGQEVEETEDIFTPILEYAENGEITYDTTVPYAYDKRKKIVSFAVKDTQITVDASCYEELKFKKSGQIVVSVTVNVNGDLMNYEIKEVL